MSDAVTPLWERGDQLAQVVAEVTRERTQAGIVAIVGEPGTGKTTLLSQALTHAHCAPPTAYCTPVSQQLPFGVLHQLWGTRAQHTEVGAAPFDGPARVLHELLRTGSTQADHLALAYALRWVLVSLADAGTVRLAIDDVQWADEVSLRILTDALSLTHDSALLLAVTVRTASLRDDPAMAELLASAVTVPIGPLSVEGVRAVLGSRALDAAQVHAHTGGVPFYVHEWTAQYDRGEPHLPSSRLATTVAARLDRLGPLAMDVAHGIVVLDDKATLGTLAHLTQLTQDKVAQVVAQLVAEGIAARTSSAGSTSVTVRHPLIHAVLTEHAGPDRIGLLHDRAAASLADQRYPLHVVAPHVLAGTPTRTPARVRMLWEYGRALRETGSGADALPYLTTALAEIAADDAARDEVLADVAAARLDAGDFAGAAAALSERAHGASTPEEAAQRFAAVGDVHLAAGDPTSAAAAYERGFQHLEESTFPLTSPLVRELAARALSAQLTLAPQLHELPERILRDIAAQDPAVDTLSDARMMVSAGLGSMMTPNGLSPAELTPLMLRAYTQWPRGRFGFSLDPMLYIFTGVLNYLDLFEHGVEILDAAVVDAQAAGNGQFEATALYCRGAMHLSAGDIRRATADLASAVAARQAGWVQYREAAETMLVRCYVAQGDLESAAAVYDVPPNPTLGPFLRSVYLVGVAELATAQGHPDQGLQRALEARDLLDGGLEATGVHWQSAAFPAAMALGDVTLAADVAASELDRAVSNGAAPSTVGLALLHSALAQEGMPGSMERVERALATIPAARTQMVAQARELYARELVAAGRTSEAGTPLAEALRYARLHRLAPMEARLVALAKVVGIPVTPSAVEHRLAQLSQAEYRVVALAADGLSNRDIAARLFVTMKTVEFHLSRSFRKLGVTSRTQLAALVEGTGASIGRW